jgi:PPOX class probable F420-dependent enzyme
LATRGPAGSPHIVPIVFVRVGGVLWSPVDAKPKRSTELARVRNIETSPEASLLLDHYEPMWDRLWWIRVDGRVRVVRAHDPLKEPDLRDVVDALRRKYPQYEDVAVLRDPATLLAIAPLAVRSWCASPEAVTIKYES